MQFIQVIEFDTDDIDGMRRIGDEWEAAAAGASKARKRVMCEDRDRPGHYVNIVFFDSYEDAMENSNHPVTQEFSQKMAAVVSAPPKFYNLNVLDER